jgi:hypothetical protein
MRRSTFTDQPVTYAAVGATLSHDLTLHPPKGYRAHSRWGVATIVSRRRRRRS